MADAAGPPVDPDALAAIAREAGELAMRGWREGTPVANVTDKDTGRPWSGKWGSPVSDADVAVDRLLRERLTALMPEAGWLSEETIDDPARLSQDYLWLVDPIDGTRDFVRGRPGWAISIALIGRCYPIVGLLHAPARGHVWLGVAGKGAEMDGRPLAASRRAAFEGARVPADSLPRIDRDLTAVEKPNSIALRMAMVASDEADLVATLHWGHEWDIGAAALIASEAGATVTDALAQPIRYNKQNPRAFGLLCSSPGIHAAAAARLRSRAESLSRQ